jgi:peptidoglycan/LPS O-acetylase OafA/YrhL
MNLPKHLFSLDITRGIAAAAVVFFHWKIFFWEEHKPPEDFDRSLLPLNSVFGRLYEYGDRAVPFFFMLSGFVFFWLYRDKVASGACSAYRFSVLRFARLYPLHVTTLLAVLGLQIIHAMLIGGFFAHPFNDAYHFLLHVVFASHWGFERGHSFNGPVWSVSIEIGLYALFFLFCRVRVHNIVKLVTILLCTMLMMKLSIGGPWGPAILAFYIGGLTYEVVDAYLPYRSPFLDACIILAAIAAWVGVLVSNRIEYLLLVRGHRCLFFLYPLTIASLVIAEARFPEFPRRAAWIGNLTYSSYLLHFPLQIIFVLVAFELGYDKTVFCSAFVLMTFMLLLTGLSWVTYQYFERPLQDLIRGMMLKKESGKSTQGT